MSSYLGVQIASGYSQICPRIGPAELIAPHYEMSTGTSMAQKMWQQLAGSNEPGARCGGGAATPCARVGVTFAEMCVEEGCSIASGFQPVVEIG
jgi:hypothetical protein